MTTTERSALINDIVAHAPSALGLAGQTQANLETMSDDALRALHAKLKLVAAHVAKTPISRRPQIAERRTALATRRAARYERLAMIGTAAGETPAAKPSAVPILEEVIASEPAGVVGSGTLHVGLAVEPHSAVRVWNHFDRESERPVEHMRLVVHSWLKDFAGKVIGEPDIQPFLRDVLEGPMRPEFENYLHLACDRIGRDALRLVRNHSYHQGVPLNETTRGLFPMVVLDGLTRAVVETEFAPQSGRIRETNAIDGLAKMRAFALHYQPDVILSVSAGGKIVGDFIAGEAKLGEPQTRLILYRGKSATVAGGWKSLQTCRRILLVDDIAADTDLLCSAHRQLQAQLGDRDIQMVALASSFETRDALIQEGHTNVFVAHVAGGKVDVPWDRTGTYQINTRNHVFGVGREGELRVDRAQLRRVSQSLDAPAGVSAGQE